jgi:hypothetical protein
MTIAHGRHFSSVTTITSSFASTVQSREKLTHAPAQSPS